MPGNKRRKYNSCYRPWNWPRPRACNSRLKRTANAFFFNPFQARDILKDARIQSSDLKFTADLSHWVVSCERQLTNVKIDPWFPAVLQQVAERTALIHCRVGYAEGPQVPEVTDPVHAADVEARLHMWMTIFQAKQQTSNEMWCEVEHGPPPYLHTLPHTGQPVADLWKVNNDVANLVRAKFQESIGTPNDE